MQNKESLNVISTYVNDRMLNKYDYMHIRTSTYFLSSLEDKDIRDDNGIAVGVLSTVCTYKHILHTILPLFTVWKCNIV